MKIRLEKLAVNISKLTSGKNVKPRRGSLHEKRRLWLEIKLTEYVICQQEAFYIIKVLRNKNNIMYMQPFYKTVPRTPSRYFCTECI